MNIIFSSKNMELTEGLKGFIERKFSKLKKIGASLGATNFLVNLDVDRKHHGATEDAVVELVGDLKHKTVVVREQDKTFYKAFFGALAKMKQVMLREKEKEKH